MQRCIVSSISYDPDVFEWLDSVRGDVKRSTFVNRIIKDRMAEIRKKK